MKYKLWIGVYESCTNAQCCLISNNKIWISLDMLEWFLKTKFRNFSKIIYVAQEPNPYITCIEIDYNEYEKFVEQRKMR